MLSDLQFFTHGTVKAAFELISFLLMLFLGIKFLRAKAVEEHNPLEDRLEEKLHPHSAFMVGFVRVLGNPGVLLLWLTLTATFIAHDWVGEETEEKLACILGVCLGTGVWFFLLSYAVSRGHRKFSPKTLLRMEHISGACLLVVALVLGIRLVALIEREGLARKAKEAAVKHMGPLTNAPSLIFHREPASSRTN